MRPWRVWCATAAAIVVAGCSGSVHRTASPSSPTDAAPTSIRASTPPTEAQIATQLARTHETDVPDETFTGDPPVTVTVPDGTGGSLTAVPARRSPSADGHGWLVFFWHNGTFLGWDTNLETWNVGVRADGHTIRATYPRYAPGDAACCPSLSSITITYRWNGSRLTQDQPLPSEAIVGVTVFTG